MGPEFAPLRARHAVRPFLVSWAAEQREVGIPPIPRCMSYIVDLTSIVKCLPTFGYKTVTSGRVRVG